MVISLFKSLVLTVGKVVTLSSKKIKFPVCWVIPRMLLILKGDDGSIDKNFRFTGNL